MGCGPSTSIVVSHTDAQDDRGNTAAKHAGGTGGGGGSPDPVVSLSLHPQRFYTLKAIAAAANTNDPDAPVLTIIAGLVYDITDFLPLHPGGEDLLRTYGAGQDCTLWFTKPPSAERPFAHVHGKSSMRMLERMKVGWIVSDDDPRAGKALEEVEDDDTMPQDHREGKAVEQYRPAEDSEMASGQRGHAYVHSRDETSAASHNAYQSSTIRMQALHRIKQVERQQQNSKHTHNASAQSVVSLPGMVSSAQPQVSVLQAYSLADIAAHATQHDCWTIAQRHQVFDVTSLVTTVPPLFDWRKTGGKDSSAYLASKFSDEQISAFLAPLHVGFVEGHSLQMADLARVPSGTRGGSMAGPNGSGGGPRRSSNSLVDAAGLDSAAARAALDAITNDDLTIAASEGLLPAPNSTRYLWRLVGSRDFTHDTKLLTFDPVTHPKELAQYRAQLSEDDRELAERFPVVYSPTPLRPAIAHHISVEIPFVLPVENQAERAQRERENRPLDVPFRMQRSYTPLDAGALVPRSSQLQLLVKSYPKVAGAHGSEYMHGLRTGDIMVSTGARSRFDFEALAAPRSDDSPKYDFWVCLVAGSGIAAVYSIIRELLRRCAAAQTREQAAAAAGSQQHVRGRSHSSRAASSDSTATRARSESYSACAPCKRIVLIYCSRSEEDIILGPELDALVEAHPSLFSVFHVLSRPLFSPKASSFSGRLSIELLRLVLPPALQPRDSAQDAIMVGGLLGAGAIPGSRPRSPVNAQARPNVQDLHARVVAAQEAVVRGSSGASSLHGSPVLLSQQLQGGSQHVMPNIAAIMASGTGSGTNSRPGSRPRSPARFHFNIPSRPTPPAEPAAVIVAPTAAAPTVAASTAAVAPPAPAASPPPQPASSSGSVIGSGRSTLLSVGVKSTPPFAPSSAPGSPMPVIGENLLHVPDGLKNLSSDGVGDSLASSHRGSHVPGGAPSALFQRLGLGGGGGGSGASGTGSGSGSARGVRTTALALVCGPIEFNGAALGLLAKFGFKRGLGNMNGKDVHLF